MTKTFHLFRILVSFLGLLMLTGGCGTRSLVVPDVEYSMPIIEGVTLSRLSPRELWERIAESDAVFVGEVHDDSLTHIIELDILRNFYTKHPKLAVSMEMFERDVQGLLDEYLAGKIREEVFLAGSRPWGNYKKAYRPIVEFAREKGLPVIAMNVPRKYAARLAMKGPAALEALPDSEKVFVARELKVLDDEYRERFKKEMTGEMPQAMAMVDPENLYAAQCLKDDTMAESIHEFLKTHAGYKVISYQGDFHSAYSLGIVKKLKLLDPSLKTTVISVVPVEDPASLDQEAHRGRGDHVIFVKRVAQKQGGD